MNFGSGVEQRINWSQLGLELLVVIIGILLALGIDSWWAGRQAADLEEAFLVQLHDDLTRAGDQLVRELEALEKAERLTLNLLEVSRGERTADNATLAGWMKQAIFWSDPRPTVSTARALAESENLYVLRDPRLRRHIVELIDRLSQLQDRLLPYEQQIFASQSESFRWIDPIDRAQPLSIGMITSDPSVNVFQTGVVDSPRVELLPIVQRAEFRATFLDIFYAQEILRFIQQEMLDATVQLRDELGVELSK